jgi:hypothetical protein
MILANEVAGHDEALLFVTRQRKKESRKDGAIAKDVEETHMPFSQYKDTWEPEFSSRVWVYNMPCKGDAVYRVSVTAGGVRTVDLTFRGQSLYSYSTDCVVERETTVTSTVCISTVHMYPGNVRLEIVSDSEPRVTAIHVYYCEEYRHKEKEACNAYNPVATQFDSVMQMMKQ